MSWQRISRLTLLAFERSGGGEELVITCVFLSEASGNGVVVVMEDDERDTASLVNGAKNVTFKLEDEDEMVDVEVPVSTSNGEDDGEPTEEADGVVEVESLWLDNTLIAHPAIGIGYFFMLWYEETEIHDTRTRTMVCDLLLRRVLLGLFFVL